MKKNTGRDLFLPLFCSVFASITFFLYAPYSLYLGNAEEFLFTLHDFILIPLICFFAVAAVLTGIGLLIKKGRTIYCAVLTGIGFMIYLQGSFLFEDTGVFNGMPYLPGEHAERILQNSLIWLLGIGIVVLLSIRAKDAERILKSVSTVFSAFIAVSAAILLFTADPAYLQPRDFFISTDGLLEAYSGKNVLILVPDMFDKTYMDTILEESPEVKESFDGFTYYQGIHGCYRSTQESLGAFLSEESLFTALAEKDYSPGIYTDGRFIPETLRDQTVNCVNESGKISRYMDFIQVLYRLVACSYAPDCIRPAVWLYGNEFDQLYTAKDTGKKVYTTSNTEFFRNLCETGVTAAEKPCMRLIHLYGSHFPYVHDEFLNPITPSFSDANAVKASRGVLMIISFYLEELKKIGAYEDSLIVIMADHGYSQPGLQTDPLLMIKEPGLGGSFETEFMDFSQKEIPEMIRELIP